MKKYQIKGLSCAGCAQKLEQAVLNREEVDRFELNFPAKKFKLSSRDEKATINFIEQFEEGIQVIDATSHSHNHEHEHGNKKYEIAKVVIAAILFMLSFGLEGKVEIVLLLTSYAIVSYNIIIKAFKNLFKGRIFDEFFLMSLATIAAISIGEISEAVAVMLFYSVGEIFQEYALENSRKAITDLLELKVESVRVYKNERYQILAPEEVEIDSMIEVRVGEKIPIDAIVQSEQALLNTAALTGESALRKYQKGEQVLAGMIVEEKPLILRTNEKFADSAIAKMLEMVETASSRKTKTERFISQFARIYTPIVIAIAIMIVLVLPFLGIPIQEAIYRAVILLVISCPCALVISVPLGYFAGIGRSAQKGILIKGANYLDQLAKVDTIMLDKTGTITKGNFTIVDINQHAEVDLQKVNQAIYAGESQSNHPIAKAIVKSLELGESSQEVEDFTELKGLGIKFKYDEVEYLIGNKELLNKFAIELKDVNSSDTLVYVAQDAQHIQTIHIADEIKQDSIKAINSFKKLSIDNVIMLTGDRLDVAKTVAEKVKITEFYANLLPEDKVEQLSQQIATGKKVGFIGDGINDAPVIAQADVGIAMGVLGSDIAIETADVVINNDSLNSLASGITIARYSRKIIMQNIIFALAIKVLVISLGIFGDATMWEAVFADVGVSLIAILNSLRIMRK